MVFCSFTKCFVFISQIQDDLFFQPHTCYMFMGSYNAHCSVRFSILQEHVQKYVLGDSGLKVDSQLVSDILFRPVRALIDRGGKAGCLSSF